MVKYKYCIVSSCPCLWCCLKCFRMLKLYHLKSFPLLFKIVCLLHETLLAKTFQPTYYFMLNIFDFLYLKMLNKYRIELTDA